MVAYRALRNSTICGELIAPQKNRKFRRQKLSPAISESCFQLRLYFSTDVLLLSAHVLTRVGRSLRPDSSTKKMVRPSLLALFLAPASALAFQIVGTLAIGVR